MTRWLSGAGMLCCLVVLGSRLYTISQRGLITYDEAYYLLETKALTDGARHLPALLFHRESIYTIKNDIRASGGIFPPGTAKPTFNAILALATIFPFHPEIFAQLTTLVMSILVCVLITAIGKHFGLSVVDSGLLGMLLFLSPLWGYYSVSALPHPYAMTFFCLAVWTYLKNKMAWTSFFLGITLTTHYGMLPTIGLFGIWLIFKTIQPQPQKQRAGALFRLACAGAAPIVIWQMIYIGGKALLGDPLSDVAYLTYAEQFMRQLARSTQPNASGYFQMLCSNGTVFLNTLSVQSWALTALLFSGFFYGLWNWKYLNSQHISLYFIAGGTLFFWLLNKGTVVSRVIVFILPLLFLTWVVAMTQFQLWRSEVQAVWHFVIVFLMVILSMQSVQLERRLRSPYRAAANFLSHIRYKGQIVDPINWPLWQFYLGRRMVIRPEALTSLNELKHALWGKDSSQEKAIVFAFVDKKTLVMLPENFKTFFGRLWSRNPMERWGIPYSVFSLYQNEGGAIVTDLSMKIPQNTLELYEAEFSDF